MFSSKVSITNGLPRASLPRTLTGNGRASRGLLRRSTGSPVIEGKVNGSYMPQLLSDKLHDSFDTKYIANCRLVQTHNRLSRIGDKPNRTSDSAVYVNPFPSTSGWLPIFDGNFVL